MQVFCEKYVGNRGTWNRDGIIALGSDTGVGRNKPLSGFQRAGGVAATRCPTIRDVTSHAGNVWGAEPPPSARATWDALLRNGRTRSRFPRLSGREEARAAQRLYRNAAATTRAFAWLTFFIPYQLTDLRAELCFPNSENFTMLVKTGG